MSCDSNRQKFCNVMAANSNVAVALGNGDARQAASVLEAVYQTAQNQAARGRQRQWQSSDMSSQARAELLAAQAGCTALFGRMIAAKLQPPVHGKPRPGQTVALPRSTASQAGYAALEQTLRAIEQGKSLPEVARDILEVRGIRSPAHGGSRTIQGQIGSLFAHTGGIAVDPDRPPLAGFLNAMMSGALDPASMSEDQFFQSMSGLIRTEEAQQRFMRAPRLIDLANGTVNDLDLAMTREIDRAAEEIGYAASGRQKSLVPKELQTAATTYQANPATAAAFARALADTAGVQRCPQCHQFISAQHHHVCPVAPRKAAQITPAIVEMASSRGAFTASFKQPSAGMQAVVDLAHAIAADAQTYGTARGAAANYLLRVRELETRYGLGVPAAAVEGACLDLAQAASEHAGLVHCGGCNGYVADPVRHECADDGSGWRMPRVIDEAVATLDSTPALVDWLNRQRHDGLSASDALTDEALSALFSASMRFRDGAIDYDLATGAKALDQAATQVGRAGLDVPQRGGTLQERSAAMVFMGYPCPNHFLVRATL